MVLDKTVDLNCDLGEGYPNDAELMRLITSANIACGYHAGDPDTMRYTIELAIENDVAIGAHPGYKDKPNFGRTAMSLTFGEIHDIVTDQILALRHLCGSFGTKLHHVKPHGALYNQAARDREIAAAIVEGVRAVDPKLVLYGLSGSIMIEEAERVGLRTASEVFADRTYLSDGTLTPRTSPNALITDEDASITQVMDMVKYGRVRSLDAIMVPITAETICIHGDGEHAVRFARNVRRSLSEAGISIAPPLHNS